jgi:hypothetical protein
MDLCIGLFAVFFEVPLCNHLRAPLHSLSVQSALKVLEEVKLDQAFRRRQAGVPSVRPTEDTGAEARYVRQPVRRVVVTGVLPETKPMNTR